MLRAFIRQKTHFVCLAEATQSLYLRIVYSLYDKEEQIMLQIWQKTQLGRLFLHYYRVRQTLHSTTGIRGACHNLHYILQKRTDIKIRQNLQTSGRIVGCILKRNARVYTRRVEQLCRIHIRESRLAVQNLHLAACLQKIDRIAVQNLHESLHRIVQLFRIYIWQKSVADPSWQLEKSSITRRWSSSEIGQSRDFLNTQQ